MSLVFTRRFSLFGYNSLSALQNQKKVLSFLSLLWYTNCGKICLPNGMHTYISVFFVRQELILCASI